MWLPRRRHFLRDSHAGHQYSMAQQASCYTCPNDVFGTAYADNWKSQFFRSHFRVLQETLKFLHFFGLEIDWNKTWCWATQLPLATRLQKSLADNLEGRVIQILTHAKDLGFELQYSGGFGLGHRQDRYNNGMKRLQRLQSMQVDLGVKEHILLASIWPAALYGSEIANVSNDLLNKLASQAADALVGHSRSMSPSLILALTSNQILDPSFYVIQLAILSARDWLLRQTDQVRLQFYHIVASPKEGATQGPASALRNYLLKIDWPMNKQGYCGVSFFQGPYPS